MDKASAPVDKATENPPDPSAPSPAPAAPAAAQVVLTGEKTERELQLEKDLEAERSARKKIECDNAQLQDEVHRLSTPAAPPAAKPNARPLCRRGPLGVRTAQ